MYWNFQLADELNEMEWPSNKKDLIDFAIRSGASEDLIANLQELPDDDELLYYGIEDLWPDHGSRKDYYYDEDEEEGHE